MARGVTGTVTGIVDGHDDDGDTGGYGGVHGQEFEGWEYAEGQGLGLDECRPLLDMASTR